MAHELTRTTLTQRRVKELARLTRARERREQGLWLLEGVALLREALAARCVVRLVAAGDDEALRHAELLTRAAAAGAELAALDARAAAKLADREHGPALLSVVERPPAFEVRGGSKRAEGDASDDLAATAGALPRSGPLLVVGLCGLQDPGNVGTLLRSARAFGAHAALLGEGGADPGNPKVLRASAGAALGLPLGRLEQLGALLSAADLTLHAAVAPADDALGAAAPSAGDSAPGAAAPTAAARVGADTTPSSDAPASAPAEAALPERAVLLLGHETRGLRDALHALELPGEPAPCRLRQEPSVESLNVAVAGSILMADWYRRWR